VSLAVFGSNWVICRKLFRNLKFANSALAFESYRTSMSPSVFDNLPIEISLLVVDKLDDPKDWRALIQSYGMRWLPGCLTRRQIKKTDEYGNTILHLLAGNGEADPIKQLLARRLGINPEVKNKVGQTPLFWAVRSGDKETVNLLLSIKYLVDSDWQDYFDWTALWWAAVRQDLEIMKMLLTQGKVRCLPLHGMTLLSWAACHGYKEIVEILLSLRPRDDLNDRNDWWSAVTEETYEGIGEDNDEAAQEMIREMRSKGPHRETRSRTPLLWAVAEGHKDVVKMLLAADGIDLNIGDREGKIPLLWAVEKGDTEIVEMLLAADGIDLNPVDNLSGQTPLICAIIKGHKEIVEMLLARHGIDPNLPDTKWDRTPLAWAKIKGYEDTVELLRSHPSVFVGV
jgi:ankyrin repeat protein